MFRLYLTCFTNLVYLKIENNFCCSVFQAKTILEAKWPEAGWIDESSVKASEYFIEAAHALRLHLKNHMTPRRGKKDVGTAPVEKPTHAMVWVARSFPPWQSTVLTCLKELYEVSTVFLYEL